MRSAALRPSRPPLRCSRCWLWHFRSRAATRRSPTDLGRAATRHAERRLDSPGRTSSPVESERTRGVSDRPARVAPTAVSPGRRQDPPAGGGSPRHRRRTRTRHRRGCPGVGTRCRRRLHNHVRGSLGRRTRYPAGAARRRPARRCGGALLQPLGSSADPWTVQVGSHGALTGGPGARRRQRAVLVTGHQWRRTGGRDLLAAIGAPRRDCALP